MLPRIEASVLTPCGWVPGQVDGIPPTPNFAKSSTRPSRPAKRKTPSWTKGSLAVRAVQAARRTHAPRRRRFPFRPIHRTIKADSRAARFSNVASGHPPAQAPDMPAIAATNLQDHMRVAGVVHAGPVDPFERVGDVPRSKLKRPVYQPDHITASESPNYADRAASPQAGAGLGFWRSAFSLCRIPCARNINSQEFRFGRRSLREIRDLKRRRSLPAWTKRSLQSRGAAPECSPWREPWDKVKAS